MMIAAHTGPIPPMLVTVVPDAATAVATRLFGAFSAASSSPISATS